MDVSDIFYFLFLLGKSKWGLSNGGLRPLSGICAQSSTIVRFCGLFGPLSKGNFRRKMTTIVGNRGQLWTSTLSPHLESPHLDFPDKFCLGRGRGTPLKRRAKYFFFGPETSTKFQDTFDHYKGQKSAISGHWRLSTGIFAFSPGSLCNLVRRAR